VQVDECDPTILAHLPWVRRFFSISKMPKQLIFTHAAVGSLGRTFIEVETQAFTLPT
jgi:hypothetical protein